MTHEVAVVAVVGRVQQAQVVPAALAVQLHAGRKVGDEIDSRIKIYR